MVTLALKDATVTRSGRAILSKASLELRPGELAVLLGPNGAGKSTLMRVLAGELRPDRGSARLGERVVHTLPGVERAQKIAVLPQSTTLAFPMRVADVVLLGRLARNRNAASQSDEAAAAAAMASVGLSDMEDREYTTLSGGEQQRVQIARVLAQIGGSPAGQFALFDEPVSSLDVAHQLRCLSVARSLAGDGVGVLVSVHDLNLAARFAERVVLMSSGRIVAAGPPDEALTPAHLRAVFGVEVSRNEIAPGVPQFVFELQSERTPQ